MTTPPPENSVDFRVTLDDGRALTVTAEGKEGLWYARVRGCSRLDSTAQRGPLRAVMRYAEAYQWEVVEAVREGQPTRDELAAALAEERAASAALRATPALDSEAWRAMTEATIRSGLREAELRGVETMRRQCMMACAVVAELVNDPLRRIVAGECRQAIAGMATPSCEGVVPEAWPRETRGADDGRRAVADALRRGHAHHIEDVAVEADEVSRAWLLRCADEIRSGRVRALPPIAEAARETEKA